MAIEIGILFAIVSMLSWGIADFFAKKSIDKIGYTKSLLFNQAISLGPIFIYAMLFAKFPTFTTSLLLISIVGAFTGIAGYLYFYKGLQKGNISIVSPLTSSWAVITSLLSIFIFGEQLTSIQIAGIVAIFAGIFLTSTNLKDLKNSINKGKTNGVFEALLAMIAWGISFVLLKFVVNMAGPIWATLLGRAIGIFFIFSWVGVSKTKIDFPPKTIFLFLAIAGFLDVIAFTTYNIGITTEYVSIVSPIAAIFPAVTIILAYIFLKERVLNNQKIGIIAILIGLLLISIV